MKLSKNEIVERWQTLEGQKKREQIIKCLINNKPIENLPFIEKIEGFFDLRGIYYDEKTTLKNIELENIDFSYSNFNYLILADSKIENVLFNMCDCTEVLQYNCKFNNCQFIKSKFRNAGFGIDGGQYSNIVFKDSNLKGAMFFYPNFSDCTFINNKLDGIDFSASHFNRVKFIGKLDDVWFRGESPKADERKVHREKGHGLNPMIVDFSQAELWFITYSNNCDLSKVIMPKDGKHFLVKNIKKVVKNLELGLERVNNEKAKKFVEEFIEMYKYHIEEQDMVILNVSNLISNAEYYLGNESENYCLNFIDEVLRISN